MVEFGGVSATDFLKRAVRSGVIWVKDYQDTGRYVVDHAVFGSPLAFRIEDC